MTRRHKKIPELVRALPASSRAVLLIDQNPGLQEFGKLLADGSAAAFVRRLAEAFPTGAIVPFGSTPLVAS